MAGLAVAVLVLLIIQYITSREYAEPESSSLDAGADIALSLADAVTFMLPDELPLEEEASPFLFEGVVEDGDTFSKLLQEWLSLSEIHEMAAICKPVYSLAKIHPGAQYVIVSSPEGFVRFEYAIDDFQRLIVSKEADGFSAKIENLPCEVRLEKKTFIVNSSLFQAVADAGEKPMLAVMLSDIFRWEVNFIKDLRERDSFAVLVEKRYLNGEFKGYGKLVAAYFTNQGKLYEAFRYADGHGTPHYFTSDGQSLKRAFLKAPLAYSRISSGYSLSRLHPIYKIRRPHPGIDYAAPVGTPVKAIGAGQVLFSGWGGDAGRYIKIKHSNGYESTYMHLSGFARGLKKGKTVRQGDVIGYVGATGSATGPHLDFRMKFKGKYVNPSTVTTPRADPVHASKMADFKRLVALYKDYLSGVRPMESAPVLE